MILYLRGEKIEFNSSLNCPKCGMNGWEPIRHSGSVVGINCPHCGTELYSSPPSEFRPDTIRNKGIYYAKKMEKEEVVIGDEVVLKEDLDPKKVKRKSRLPKSKVCYCGFRFWRGKNESDAKWISHKYCSRTCSGRAGGRKAKKIMDEKSYKRDE